MRRFFAKFCVAAAVVIAMTGGVAVPAHAQKFLEKYAPVLKDQKMMPEKDFEAKTDLHEDTPAGDVALSYKFRLPKDWQKPGDSALTSYQVSNKVLGELVRYYGPPALDARSFFSIQAINLQYKLSANEWLLQYLLANGYTIQGLRAYSDTRAEALFVKVEQDVTYVIRAIAEINGRRVVLAQYYLSAENWDTEKQLQAQVVSTFQLTHPVQEDVEKMSKYHFLDISEFQYPESWEFKPAPLRNAERLTFELLNVASSKVVDWKNTKTLNGRIEINIISTDVTESMQAEVDSLKSGLARLDLVPGDKIEARPDIKFNEGVTPGEMDVYEVTDAKGGMLKYEYWITPVEAGGYYYLFTLVTPSRDEDFFTWSRNWQTYRVIIESLKPLEESLIER